MSALLLHKISEVKENIIKRKNEKLTIGLVPTMGALHSGHASLIKKAKETCDFVVVSIFVNPIQFGPNEDLEKYPRTLDKDKALCDELGVNLIFAPNAKEMYGDKKLSNTDLTFVCPAYNYVDCMCGKSRVGHFDGVATVVTKLFNITTPDYAFFGQKDAQQLFIIKKIVEDLNMNVKIIPCPIVREDSGLALSSRNSYLSATEKQKALTVSKALNEVKNAYLQGIVDTEILFDTAIAYLDKSLEIEYIDFRDYSTFEQLKKAKSNTLVAIAVKNGTTRLIDNIIL